MNEQHTPGPWIVTRGRDKTHPNYVESQHPDFGGFDLAHCVESADAALISAAPDLLAALHALVDYFGPLPGVDNGLDEALTNARAAIARATGKVSI